MSVIPEKIKAKVDSGINKRRSSSSHRMILKEKSFLMPRFNSSKEVSEDYEAFQSLRMSFDG